RQSPVPRPSSRRAALSASIFRCVVHCPRGLIMSAKQPQVVEAIVQWALKLERPLGQTRVNRRLEFGVNAATARAVAATLPAHSDDRCSYVVRCSTDFDAVKLRNERPAGINSTTA